MNLLNENQIIIGALYLIAAALFILGLKRLGSPATARSGNAIASLGMLVAIVATLTHKDILRYEGIVAALIVGALIGTIMAKRVQMTAMPQMVAIFNGLGGGASALVAVSEFVRITTVSEKASIDITVTIMIGTLIGLVTFSGSIIAFGKLQDIFQTRPVVYPLQKSISGLLFLAIIAGATYLVIEPNMGVLIAVAIGCLILGILLVIPIGGADMPVVISLLNSYSGLAAAAAGFALNNAILIIAGSFVGAAGLILTNIMTKAMNRSLKNVIFGTFGQVSTSTTTGDNRPLPVRDVTAGEAIILMAYARSVIFVPGYGLAVAQAQHRLGELADLLEAKGVQVRYAIHPVAGRMPGHMNVLLAEAEVSYDKLYDLDQINDQFSSTDVTLVIGANDVVNPAARDQTDSPIYGMPILDVDYSGHVLVLKRSMNTGFAGIDNELFYKDNTMMLFGDAKTSISNLISELNDL